MTQMTEACPECDSGRTDKRTSQTPTYRCRDCFNEFDEPSIRQSRRDYMCGSLADKLHMADPDDVSRETAGLE